MKTFPVYTILWVVSFLIKHGQPASFPVTPNHYINTNSDFMTELKTSEMETIPDIKETRVKRNAAEASQATNKPRSAQIFDAQGSLITLTESSTPASLTTLKNSTKFTTPEVTIPLDAFENIISINTTEETLTNTSYVTSSTNVTLNVTQFDTQTPSMNASEVTSSQYVTVTPIIVSTTKAGLHESCTTNTSCNDTFTICKNGVCVCKEDYFEDNSTCKEKAALNGNCTTDIPCKDTFICENEVCVCKEDYFEDNSMCKTKAALNESCTMNTHCKDKSAICKNGVCVCKEDNFEENSMCKKKSALNGNCTTDISCKDTFTICENEVCVCKEDYFEDNSTCKEKAGLHENCTLDTHCKDKFAICKNEECVCKKDYFEENSTCKKKAGLHEKCTMDKHCKDKFAICKKDKCACQEDYFKDNFMCKKKVAIDQKCAQGGCIDKRSYCNESKVCVCYDIYFSKNGICTRKIQFGEQCENGDQCKDRNAICSTETKECACSENYKQRDNKCIKIVFPDWFAAIIVVIILLVILVFLYLYFCKFKQATVTVNFFKLKPFKTVSHKRPYKIKNFQHIDSNTLIQDYKIIVKVNPFILTEESDLTSRDTFLPCHEAQKIQNKKKNRFLNVLPFDHSRVKLDVVDDDPFSDYINASYIKGYNQEREYIACQGPLIHTVDDFWRMVWQENINLIVMLTLCEENGKQKCYPYWPVKENLKVISRDILLETDVIITHEYYNESDILVNMDEETRIVKHLHFQKWPDFSATVDPTVLINFIKIIRSHFTQAPILIHCSAGVGRTGTLIAVDYMLQYVRDHTIDDSIDVFSFVYNMRESRPQMVQNQDQYLLINACVKRAIMNKFNLKVTEVNKDEDNKKNEVRVNIEDGEDTEKDTVTDEDDADDSEANKILANKVEEKEDNAKEPTVKVEANVAAVNTNKVESAKKDVIEGAKDEEESMDDTGDTGEDKDANSNMYSNDYQEDVDERIPLTQETSEL